MSVFLFCVFVLYFVYSVFLYCFVYCFSFSLYDSCPLPIFAPAYRPLPAGGNPTAVNKYHKCTAEGTRGLGVWPLLGLQGKASLTIFIYLDRRSKELC